jgi:hypothetical protein
VDLGIGEIDFIGLANADSYSYANDLLSIYAGNTIIDTLRLHQLGTPSLPFAVEKTETGVSLYTIGSQTTPPPGTILPSHS